VDAFRNWSYENWQKLVDELVANEISVSVCGTKETSWELQNITHNSYDYADVDTDIELMNSAKLVITQESGLQYLSFMCKRPTVCVGHYHKDHGADLYRDLEVPFKALNYVWEDPDKLIEEVLFFIKEGKFLHSS
jgi:ADP-heptose:LPS heptosyltransferase